MADNNNNSDDDDDNELYDEFGNYIGPELDSSDDDSSDDDDDDESDDDDQQSRPDGGGDDDRSVVSGIDADDATNANNNANAMVIADESLATKTADPVNAIVLHEDKEHYPSAEETYGEGVRTAVLDEDAMDLDQPIVEPVVIKSHHVASAGDGDDDGSGGDPTKPKRKQTLRYLYNDEFLTSHLLSNETTETRRGIALVGHLHHGKTSLVDAVMEPTLEPEDRWDPADSSAEDPTENKTNNGPTDNRSGTLRYTDITQSERERQMSLQSCPITLALPDTRGKSYAITMIDCPGHVQFHDESVAALRAVDGAVLAVDAAEGIMMHTEMLIRQIVAEGLPVCLVITKIDRLIVELRLPPRDAYFKLLNVVESVNRMFRDVSRGRYPPLSPSKGNVAFSSALHGWLFTLSSITAVYAEHSMTESLGRLTAEEFSSKLWGDWWYDAGDKRFVDDPSKCTSRQPNRSFVTWCLEPLYKIYSACLGESEEDVASTLKPLGVHLTKAQLRSSARPLLRMALSRFLETASCGFVDMVVRHVPSPSAAARGKIARCYTGPLDAPFVRDMVACKAARAGRFIGHVTKLYSSSDGRSFDALVRIYCGTCKPGQRVKVLGEGYVPDEDDEDTAAATVESIAVPRGRCKTPVTLATAGNWVILGGVDATIAKTATIVGFDAASANDGDEALPGDDDEGEEEHPVHIFAPLRFPFAGGESTVKLALEPLNPAELPKMVQGLRSVGKAYPMVRTRVEESGEHVLYGTGELYLDCVLHDLRYVYGDVEVKVADPSVALRETVVDTSGLKCFAETTNRKNKLTFIAEPLDDGLAERLETGTVKLKNWDLRKTGRFFQSQYGWDLLSSRSVWAFGDSPSRGTNLLLDDTLPSEVDKTLLESCRSSIVQGFRWATREGPLCEEPVRAAKLKILEVSLADKAIHRGGGQIIPTARRTVHSALLTATPRLMEPVARFQIQCHSETVRLLQPLLKRRRGHIVRDAPIGGTILYSVRGFLPILDSFGFETDLRTFTQGQATVHSVFDHWAVLPGDPLDKSILLHPLEPSPPHVLARELLLKTRRRKGLSEDVSIDKFFDAAMREQMNATTAANNDGKPLVEEVEEGEEPAR